MKLDLTVCDPETGEIVLSTSNYHLTDHQLHQISAILQNSSGPVVVMPLEIDWQCVPEELQYAKLDDYGDVYAFNLTDTGLIEPGTLFLVPKKRVINSLFVDRSVAIRRPAGV